MSERDDDAERLARLTAVADAPTGAESLERLLDAAADCAPRMAVFLLRAGRLRGWRCRGYDDAPRRRFDRIDLDGSQTWLAPLLTGAASVGLLARDAGDAGPDFGQTPADEAVAAPLRAGPTVVGVVLAERFRGQQPWSPVGLGALALLTRLRLALDLERRRPAPPSPPPLPPSAPAPSDVSFRAPVIRAREESGLVPVEESEAPRQVAGRRGDAIRFARLVASDIRLYNEDAVVSGRSHRDLAARLEREMERGRLTFLRRFSDLGDEGLAVLHEAYVELLAGGDASLLRRVSS